LRPFKDWVTDLATRKSEPRSTKELRETLLSIIQDELIDEMDKRLNDLVVSGGDSKDRRRLIMETTHIRTYACREKIDGFNKETLLAVLAASSNPNYVVSQNIRESVTADSDIRSTALFFDTLDCSELPRNCYFIALHQLAEMDGKEDVFRLHRSNPEAANSLLLLIIHFLSDGSGVGEIHPDIKSMVMENPDIVHDMLTFVRQRNLMFLTDLHPEPFLAAMETSYRPLMDGVL
jgi:hypothetical protein